MNLKTKTIIFLAGLAVLIQLPAINCNNSEKLQSYTLEQKIQIRKEIGRINPDNLTVSEKDYLQELHELYGTPANVLKRIYGYPEKDRGERFLKSLHEEKILSLDNLSDLEAIYIYRHLKKIYGLNSNPE